MVIEVSSTYDLTWPIYSPHRPDHGGIKIVAIRRQMTQSGQFEFFEVEGSEGGSVSQPFYAKAGDIQAKPTRLSGGFDFLVFFIQEPLEVFS